MTNPSETDLETELEQAAKDARDMAVSARAIGMPDIAAIHQSRCDRYRARAQRVREERERLEKAAKAGYAVGAQLTMFRALCRPLRGPDLTGVTREPRDG